MMLMKVLLFESYSNMVYSQSQIDLMQIFVHHRVPKHLGLVLSQHTVSDV